MLRPSKELFLIREKLKKQGKDKPRYKPKYKPRYKKQTELLSMEWIYNYIEFKKEIYSPKK